MFMTLILNIYSNISPQGMNNEENRIKFSFPNRLFWSDKYPRNGINKNISIRENRANDD